MILPLLIEGASHAVEADVPFNHIGLGTCLQLGGFVIACMGGWFGFRRHQRDVAKAGQDAEARIVDALKEQIAQRHLETSEDLCDLEKRIEKVETKAEAFLPEPKIEKMVVERVDELKHRHAQELQKLFSRVDRIETGRTADVERIVKLETNMVNIEKGQERIENAMDKNHRETMDAMKVWADQFSQSIREIRNVAPK